MCFIYTLNFLILFGKFTVFRSERIKKEISQRKELTHGTNGGSSQKHELLRWEDTTAADEAIANNNKLVNAHSNINQVSSNEVLRQAFSWSIHKGTN